MTVDAVIFDWGGTLTRWHDVDFHEEALALAQAVVQTADEPVDLGALAPRLHEANSAIWGRSRDEQRSSTIGDLFTEAGLDHDPELLHAYYDFWEPHTLTDPEVRPMFEELHAAGLKVGVLSNTIWPRAFAAAMEAVGVADPAACVYVGDRLFDDVWGAHQAGMRAVHIPLSTIPPGQVGHTAGSPDGVIHALSELPGVLGRL